MILPISFAGTVAAGSEKSLSSKRISTPFRIKGGAIYMARGYELLVQIRVFVSPDSYCPSSGTPSGVNIFSQYGEKEYILGEDCLYPIPIDVEVVEAGMYLKIYAYNTDAVSHSIAATFFIEPKEA